MTTAPVHVRVGIVSWNTAGLLDRCLAALPAALAGLEATIVVVDNASTDASAVVAAGHRGVTVIRNADNVGYARAMNQALGTGGPSPGQPAADATGDRDAAGAPRPAARAAAADVLIALNPDTEPPPGSLAALAEHLCADPGLGLLAPRLVHPDGTVQHSVHRFPSPRQAATVLLVPRWWQRRTGIGRRWWTEGLVAHDRSVDVDWALGAVHVIRTAALDGAQPYSPRWFMYVEDLDLCWRLRRGGWRCRLDASVTVAHVGDASGRQAWGDERATRWLDATYDWYAGVHGRSAMRRWAAVNVVAVVVHGAASAGRGLLGGTAAGTARHRARALVGLLPLHLRALWSGPPPLAGAPSGPALIHDAPASDRFGASMPHPASRASPDRR